MCISGLAHTLPVPDIAPRERTGLGLVSLLRDQIFHLNETLREKDEVIEKMKIALRVLEDELAENQAQIILNVNMRAH